MDDSPFHRFFRGSPPRWVLLTLLCLVAVVRGRYVESQVSVPDPDAYGEVAEILYEGNRFAIYPQRFGIIRDTATRPPLYPLLLYPAYLVGVEPRGAASLLHAVLAMVTVAALWQLARLWGLPPGVALVAGLLVTIDPILLALSAQLMTETLATALATVMLVALTCAARNKSYTWAAVAGLCGGLAILCRPEFLVWIAVVALAFPFAALGPRRIARLALLLSVVAATLAPWAIRNYRLLGSPVATTTHGGQTLLLANNPQFYEYLRTAPWGSAWDGNGVYQQYLNHLWDRATELRYVDELEGDRWAYRQAFDNIRAEPAMFAWSCVVRVGRLWNVLPHQRTADEAASRRGLRYAVAIWYSFELALAGLAVWFVRKKLLHHPLVWGTLLVLSITAVHALYWSDMRMRAPLVPLVCLAAAYALATLACARRGASGLSQEA